MKNRLWKMMMVSGLLVSAMAVSGVEAGKCAGGRGDRGFGRKRG